MGSLVLPLVLLAALQVPVPPPPPPPPPQAPSCRATRHVTRRREPARRSFVGRSPIRRAATDCAGDCRWCTSAGSDAADARLGRCRATTAATVSSNSRICPPGSTRSRPAPVNFAQRTESGVSGTTGPPDFSRMRRPRPLTPRGRRGSGERQHGAVAYGRRRRASRRRIRRTAWPASKCSQKIRRTASERACQARIRR